MIGVYNNMVKPDPMPELLPDTTGPRLIQAPGTVRRKAFDALDHLLVVLPARPRDADWRVLPNASQLRAAARRAGKDQPVHGRLSNARGTGITVARLPEDAKDCFSRLKFAGELMASVLNEHPGSLGVWLTGHPHDRSRDIADALLRAAHAHAFAMPEWHSKPPRKRKLKSVHLLGMAEREDFRQTEIAARAQNLARWLTALPPNRLDAVSYLQLVRALSKQHGWSLSFLDEAKLEKLGAGAFLAVSRGNASRDAGIIHLRYRPQKTAGRSAEAGLLALVGKGIIFDTGGNNLKPHKSMLDMHEDMAGSAVALATLVALTELEHPQPVDCWLAVTENRISATAYKSRDVVTASNGTTIEVMHTDAEGRMVLADTLALAGQQKPQMIIDYATLTGACVYALTERYSGVFTNREHCAQALIETGRRSGERVWPFPMDADYEEDLKSKVADTLQCSLEGSGDHILAARFLQRFVPKSSDWIHVDLSSASRKGGLGQVPGGATGFGVRLTIDFLYREAADD